MGALHGAWPHWEATRDVHVTRTINMIVQDALVLGIEALLSH